MNEERKLILEMFKEGKINLEDAEKLLEGINTNQSQSAPEKSFNKHFLQHQFIEFIHN